MARLYQKRGDYQAAAEWFRKERDRNPSLGEDPNISIILALGSIGTAARIDEALTKIANAHLNEHAIVESVLDGLLAGIRRPRHREQAKMGFGDLVAELEPARRRRPAAHCFAWVVERELHTTIFAAFKDDSRSRPELFTLDDEDSKPFVHYLTAAQPSPLDKCSGPLTKHGNHEHPCTRR